MSGTTDHGALTASMPQPFPVTLNQLLYASTPALLLKSQWRLPRFADIKTKTISVLGPECWGLLMECWKLGVSAS
jgi:hypothetical protein